MPEERYRGTDLVQWIGKEGHQKIKASTCAVIGCGALGSVSANLLVRHGVGRVKIVDRDYVELSNLERQTLFTESDAIEMRPKAIAAADRLSAANSEVKIEPYVVDLNPRNAEKLLEEADVVLDGTDNLETRYLINDVCVKTRKPWVHGACLATAGTCFNILPGGACFRCLYGDPPRIGRVPTCESEGILPSVPQIVGALQVSEAIKIVCGSNSITKDLIHIDLDSFKVETIAVERLSQCPTCAGRTFDYLKKKISEIGLALCGRNAVQITPHPEREVDLEALGKKLEKMGEVSYKGFLLNFRKEDHQLVVFPDGRAIVKGTKDVGIARSLYSRYVGS